MLTLLLSTLSRGLTNNSMDECNTILSAYTLYRHLGWCCTHPSNCGKDNRKYFCGIQNNQDVVVRLCNAPVTSYLALTFTE